MSRKMLWDMPNADEAFLPWTEDRRETDRRTVPISALDNTELQKVLIADTSSLSLSMDSDHEQINETYDSKFETAKVVRRESSIEIATQVFVPYLVAGFGMVAAGLVLDLVQHWNVFRSVSQIFIMVPALLGLKGNLEMTLASRLSTQANLGVMDRRQELWKMAVGNIVLTQAQAIVVGFLVSVAAATFTWLSSGTFDHRSSVLLGASAVITSSLASLLLGVVMIVVIVLSRKCNVNPDNVATPVAASLGDLTTLCLLAAVSSTLFKLSDSSFWLVCVILLAFLAITPIWIYVARQNAYTKVVVYDGWIPVISAMLISSIGGIILERSVEQFPGLAAFQPVINGVGGNLAAIQASRLSTVLHLLYVQPGRTAMLHRHESGVTVLRRDYLESNESPFFRSADDGIILRHSACPNPLNTFFGRQMHCRTARVLLLMAVPGHLIFMYSICFMEAGHTTIRLLFVTTYISTATIQIVVLLFIARWLVQFLWKHGKDPDNFAIPYLTAIGDILGTALLAAAFHILSATGNGNTDIGD